MTRREPLVIVGAGMVALRLLERLREQAPGRYDVTVVGAEPLPPYNRILLSGCLAGETDESGCVLRDAAWYRAGGVRLLTGAPATAIDRAARTVTVGGKTIPYERLVLATGSHPIRLPLPGADLPGIVAFRDLAHVGAMREAARSGARAVVIGGGLLGLEAAHGLARLGVETTLLHVMDRLMERQLDGRAARLVLAAMERKGVRVILRAETVGFEGEEAVTGVRLADGRVLPADLVVMAVGVRPAAEIAREAGLAVGRGVLVDDRLATSDPRVFAVGECAEHRGVVYGLVEPGYEQAGALARTLADEAASYGGSTLATSLKVSGLPVFSAGEVADDAPGEPIILSEPRAGVYRKLVLRNGRLVGAVLVGDVAEAPWYVDLIRSGAPVSGFRSALMFGRPANADREPLPLAA